MTEKHLSLEQNKNANTMPKVALSNNEKIIVAAVSVLGHDSLDMCYRMLKPDSTVTDPFIFSKMANRWWNSPMVKAFANDLRAIHQQSTSQTIEMETDENEPITRNYLIKELRIALRSTTDPTDRANISMKLADLAGLKGKDDERNEVERRHFYLPFVSHCRTCKIMQLFKEITLAKKEDLPTKTHYKSCKKKKN